MSAVTDDELVMVPVVRSPEDTTAARHRAEKVLGKRIPVPKREAEVYHAAGLPAPLA